MSPKKKPSKLSIAQGQASAKEADEALTKPQPSPLSLEVDELGDLEAWSRSLLAAAAAVKFERIDALRKAIRERFVTAPAADPQTADGERFTCILGIQSAPCNVSFVRAGSRTLKVYGKV